MVIFGIMMTTLSSFGQTFLLSLYVPFLIEEFTLSNSSLSSYYGVATIASAALLPKVGKLIDTISIRLFTLMTTILFVVSLTVFSLASVWWMIPVSFFGLRLAGQGLYSHISITAMSRYFDTNRGKAISMASLGHPLGQAVFPGLMLLLIATIGWRESLWVNAGVVGVVVIFFTQVILKDRHLKEAEASPAHHSSPIRVRQRDILRSKEFWLLAPNVFFIPFAITGLFFYQVPLIEFKKWPEELLAAGLTVYALAGTVSILAAGPLIDRYRARTFFPWYLIPFFIALVGLWLISGSWGIFVYMILMGLSVGFGSAILASLQVEFFGQQYIGTVRSLFASMMVLSSALGPAVYGLVLDYGSGFGQVIPLNLWILAPIIVVSFRSITRFRMVRWKVGLRMVLRRRF